MISYVIVSAFLAVCMTTFFTMDLYNIMAGTRERGVGKAYAEVKPPHWLLFSLAAVSSLLLFVLSVLYIILSLFGVMDTQIFTSIQLPNNEFIQGTGIVLTAMGYTLFISSVIVRGDTAYRGRCRRIKS